MNGIYKYLQQAMLSCCYCYFFPFKCQKYHFSFRFDKFRLKYKILLFTKNIALHKNDCKINQ